MKKTILAGASMLLAVTFANAQNVWTGTTTPTSTSASLAVGTTTFGPSKVIIRNIQNPSSTTNSALRINNGWQGSPTAPAFEVWNGSYSIAFNPTTGTATEVFNPVRVFYVHSNEEVGTKANLKVGTSLSVGTTASIAQSLRIGTTAANGAYAGYKLSVDGDMIAKKCVIQVSNWADYVFADDYALPELSDVKDFITKNKHLPDVPSEAAVLENGIEMGEMNKILLKKIEELTLYTIKLSEEVEQLKKTNKN